MKRRGRSRNTNATDFNGFGLVEQSVELDKRNFGILGNLEVGGDRLRVAFPLLE
jgi:hypothetical protein